MTDAEGRPQRPRRYAPPPKPKAPLWAVVVFIGVPSVAIVVLLGVLIKQKLFDGGAQVQDDEAQAQQQQQQQRQALDTEKLLQEATVLVAQARKLKTEARKKLNEDKDASIELKLAAEKFKQAKEKYEQILERIKIENKGVVPADYAGYQREISRIQQDLLDTVKMKGFK